MKRIVFLLVILLTSLFKYNAIAYSPQDCLRCHLKGSAESTLYISIENLKASKHGNKITCLDCHIDIEDKSHTLKKGSVTVNCNNCHPQENKHGLTSPAGERPKCYSCHTKHTIYEKENPASSVYSKNLKKTCRNCHSFASGKKDYLSWFPSVRILTHGKQDMSRTYDKNNCIGCHQGQAAHGEPEIIDDQSCHRCHNSKGQNALWGKMHPNASLKKQPAIFGAAIVYQLFGVVLLYRGIRFLKNRLTKKQETDCC